MMVPPSTANEAATAQLQAQITGLGERMTEGFTELKELLRAYEERTRAIETREAGCQPIIMGRIEAVWRRVDEHDTRLATKSQQINDLEKGVLSLENRIDKRIAKLAVMYNILGVIGGAFLLSIIGLIWALITGQASVVFR